jgi:hypothetical protein
VAEPYLDCNGDPIVVEHRPPPPLTSADRRARIACYHGIIREMRQRSSREGRRMTWAERWHVNDLLADIEALEAEESSA